MLLFLDMFSPASSQNETNGFQTPYCRRENSTLQPETDSQLTIPLKIHLSTWLEIPCLCYINHLYIPLGPHMDLIDVLLYVVSSSFTIIRIFKMLSVFGMKGFNHNSSPYIFYMPTIHFKCDMLYLLLKWILNKWNLFLSNKVAWYNNSKLGQQERICFCVKEYEFWTHHKIYWRNWL
jgi:hypothetical protein